MFPRKNTTWGFRCLVTCQLFLRNLSMKNVRRFENNMVDLEDSEGIETCVSDINNTCNAFSIVCYNHKSRYRLTWYPRTDTPCVQAIYKSTDSRSTLQVQPNRQAGSIMPEGCSSSRQENIKYFWIWCRYGCWTSWHGKNWWPANAMVGARNSVGELDEDWPGQYNRCVAVPRRLHTSFIFDDGREQAWCSLQLFVNLVVDRNIIYTLYYKTGKTTVPIYASVGTCLRPLEKP